MKGCDKDCIRYGERHPDCVEHGEVASLRDEVDGLVAQRAMTVYRLGGEVEGAPTHAGNFLQRIDALRNTEYAVEGLRAALAAVKAQAHPPNGSGLTLGDIVFHMERIADAALAVPGICLRCQRGDHSAHGDPTRPQPNGCLWCRCGHGEGCPCVGCATGDARGTREGA